MADTDRTRIFTRNEYVREGAITHHDYFAQFVTEDTIRHVLLWFTPEILADALAADEHLNSIPLARWDAMTINELDSRYPGSVHRRGRFSARIPFDRVAVASARDYITRAGLTCIAKCAARIIIDRHATLVPQAA